jgi:putative ABC transport system ATP-binding protein
MNSAARESGKGAAVVEDRAAAVEVVGLTKVFGAGATRTAALQGIDLRVAAGEFVAVMGPSGSGKSTLLHLIGGLDRATTGTLRVGDEDLGRLNDDQLALLRRRRIGFIFQAFNLLDVLTAQENVALALAIDGVPEAEAQQQAGAALAQVGLDGRRHHLPGALSGGEQQRVAVARALVRKPLLLLADEPTGNLDSSNGDQVMHLLRQLVDERRQTILMVTHDEEHALLADRLILLRDGRVVKEQILRQGMTS